MFKSFWLPASIIAAIDLLSKHYVFAWLRDTPLQEYAIVDGWLRFILHINAGALWGFASSAPLLLLLFTAIIIPLVIFAAYSRKNKAAPTWALGLILGGAIGNFYDRIFTNELIWNSDELQRGVRDFISMSIPDVYSWPVYNVADIAIVLGVVAFSYANFFTNHK